MKTGLLATNDTLLLTLPSLYRYLLPMGSISYFCLLATTLKSQQPRDLTHFLQLGAGLVWAGKELWVSGVEGGVEAAALPLFAL